MTTPNSRNYKHTVSRLKWFIYDFINGIYSGLPLCCVINYCKDTSPEGVALATAKKYGLTWNEFGRIPIEYVPCRRCFENKKFIKIKLNGTICDFIINKRGQHANKIKS